MANVPLLPGKIPTARCEDAMNIYAMAGEEFWDKYKDSSEAFMPGKKQQADNLAGYIATLEAIENLALNCARRKAFIKARTGNSGLRVGSGDKAELTATIPEPGVPEKYPIDKQSIGKDSAGNPTADRWLESITLAMDQDENFSKTVRVPNSDHALLRAVTGGGQFEINKMKTAKDVLKKEKEFQDLRRQYIGRIGIMGMQQVQGGMDLPSKRK